MQSFAPMGAAIGQILPLAIGVGLSPIPIIAMILMLATPRARANGPAFLAGWLVGLAVVGTIALLIEGPTDTTGSNGGPATWVSVAKLLMGALLLLVAARQWKARPHDGEEAPAPKWMGAIEAFSPVKALGAGAVLAGANPKNLLLAIAAATTIAQAELTSGQEAVAYAVFVIIGTIGVGAPIAIYFGMGERAGPILDGIKQWMGRNNAVIMSVLCLVIAAKLIGDAISGFSA